MDSKETRKWVFWAVLVIAVFGIVIFIRNTVLTASVGERQASAQATLNLFYENLSAGFDNLNFAEQLSHTVDGESGEDLESFAKVSEKLLSEHQNIVSLSYFEGDKLKAIFPEEEYKEVLGTDLNRFSYSYTLAKVLKDAVIEGPEQMAVTQKEVFLFIYPIVNDNEYKGEIVAAVDEDSVMEQMDLDLLREGGYNYELWRVNALGEQKNVIAKSNPDIDFSHAVKITFNLPSTWTLSIIPENGWLPVHQRVLTDVFCAAGGLLTVLLAVFIRLFLEQKKKLLRAEYTEPDSGLYTPEGFCCFVDQKLQKGKKTKLCLLYIKLSNFHKMAAEVSRSEVLEYFSHIGAGIKDIFPEETPAARLSEEVIVIALFEEQDEERLEEMIEEFVLLLFWKKKIGERKEFVNPKYCMAEYPADGSDAAALLQHAAENFNIQK